MIQSTKPNTSPVVIQLTGVMIESGCDPQEVAGELPSYLLVLCNNHFVAITTHDNAETDAGGAQAATEQLRCSHDHGRRISRRSSRITLEQATTHNDAVALAFSGNLRRRDSSKSRSQTTKVGGGKSNSNLVRIDLIPWSPSRTRSTASPRAGPDGCGGGGGERRRIWGR
ncbi:hypothetical protein TIFTF001_021228 [Ficus carica]|uniref:Uncharacterized protein n=1 Tax=Ficus carica TaxID=3494 RepID=A0AA88AHK4_FICCA|nr:hypothetical protein TIFTF001_021228 [Ficus carica]